MKLPRDLDATDLIKALRRIGYEVERQSGSPSDYARMNQNRMP